jgi:superfamily II DNA/RNA helicase
LATAPTGTGKTAAFLLPLLGVVLRKLSRDGLPRNKAYPSMVILVPTHELVMQVNMCQILPKVCEPKPALYVQAYLLMVT